MSNMKGTRSLLTLAGTVFTYDATRFALHGMPFTIHVLIGKAPEIDTPMDAVEYKNIVGQVFNFMLHWE